MADLDRTVIRAFGRDWQASSLLAGFLLICLAGGALAVGLTVWPLGKGLALVLAVMGGAVMFGRRKD